MNNIDPQAHKIFSHKFNTNKPIKNVLQFTDNAKMFLNGILTFKGEEFFHSFTDYIIKIFSDNRYLKLIGFDISIKEHVITHGYLIIKVDDFIELDYKENMPPY